MLAPPIAVERAAARRDARTATRVREALSGDQFVVYAQPIVSVRGGHTVSHELLVRMREPCGSLATPRSFLPAAERCGLVAEIDRWMIGEALALAATGSAVQINVSGATLADPALAAYVESELHDSGADPADVVFELTETALPRDDVLARSFLRRVRELGCGVALDDFGTAYGAFTNLKRFDVDFLKIDVEFVRDLPRSEASGHVVRSIVGLARDFGIRTIAEGVEHAETLPLLEALGVDFAQGYAIGRPAAPAVAHPAATAATPRNASATPIA